MARARSGAGIGGVSKIDLGIDGRVAIVTCASKGIGAATARRLAEAGVSVVLGARSIEDLEAVVARITSAGANTTGVAVDVPDPTSAATLRATPPERFGRVDIIVNNAGGEAPRWATSTRTSGTRRTP